MWDVVPGRRLRVALELGHSVTATPRSFTGHTPIYKVYDIYADIVADMHSDIDIDIGALKRFGPRIDIRADMSINKSKI
jgi:hypothetical protein